MWTRDSLVWTISFLASILAFIVTNTTLVPEEYFKLAVNISAVLGFVSGKLGMSMLPHSGTGDAVKPSTLVGVDPKP